MSGASAEVRGLGRREDKLVNPPPPSQPAHTEKVTQDQEGPLSTPALRTQLFSLPGLWRLSRHRGPPVQGRRPSWRWAPRTEDPSPGVGWQSRHSDSKATLKGFWVVSKPVTARSSGSQVWWSQPRPAGPPPPTRGVFIKEKPCLKS